LEGARKDFEKKGIDTAFLDKLAQQNQEKTDKAKKRRRYSSDHDMEVEDVEPRSRSRSKIRNMSRSRSRGAPKAELTPKEQVILLYTLRLWKDYLRKYKDQEEMKQRLEMVILKSTLKNLNIYILERVG